MTFIKENILPPLPTTSPQKSPDYSELKISFMWQWKGFILIFEVDPETTWSEKDVSPSNQRLIQKGQQFWHF